MGGLAARTLGDAYRGVARRASTAAILVLGVPPSGSRGGNELRRGGWWSLLFLVRGARSGVLHASWTRDRGAYRRDRRARIHVGGVRGPLMMRGLWRRGSREGRRAHAADRCAIWQRAGGPLRVLAGRSRVHAHPSVGWVRRRRHGCVGMWAVWVSGKRGDVGIVRLVLRMGLIVLGAPRRWVGV